MHYSLRLQFHSSSRDWRPNTRLRQIFWIRKTKPILYSYKINGLEKASLRACFFAVKMGNQYGKILLTNVHIFNRLKANLQKPFKVVNYEINLAKPYILCYYLGNLSFAAKCQKNTSQTHCFQ